MALRLDDREIDERAQPDDGQHQPEPPEPVATTRLKIRESRRRLNGSCRRAFQPETRSYPSSSLTSSRGISAGSSWRSASIVTIVSPRAWAKPEARAAALPKLRRSRT